MVGRQPVLWQSLLSHAIALHTCVLLLRVPVVLLSDAACTLPTMFTVHASTSSAPVTTYWSSSIAAGSDTTLEKSLHLYE